MFSTRSYFEDARLLRVEGENTRKQKKCFDSRVPAAEMDLSRCFLAPGQEEQLTEEEQSKMWIGGNCAVVFGPSGTGKRSLCWSLCLSVGGEAERAYLVCKKSEIEQQGMPALPGGVSEESSLWSRVDVRYAEHAKDVVRALMALQELPVLPCALVLPSLDSFFPPVDSSSPQEAASLAALLVASLSDALLWLSERFRRLGRSSPPLAFISCALPPPPPLLAALRRLPPSSCFLIAQPVPSSPSSCVLYSASPALSPMRPIVKYSIRDGRILLNNVL